MPPPVRARVRGRPRCRWDRRAQREPQGYRGPGQGPGPVRGQERGPLPAPRGGACREALWAYRCGRGWRSRYSRRSGRAGAARRSSRPSAPSPSPAGSPAPGARGPARGRLPRCFRRCCAWGWSHRPALRSSARSRSPSGRHGCASPRCPPSRSPWPGLWRIWRSCLPRRKGGGPGWGPGPRRRWRPRPPYPGPAAGNSSSFCSGPCGRWSGCPPHSPSPPSGPQAQGTPAHSALPRKR